MPARNMAGPLAVPANPSTWKFVIMSPFSGPKGSLFDRDQPGNHSTGALNTGIGMGCNMVIPISVGAFPPTPAGSIKAKGFTDDYTPGITMPGGTPATTAILTAIGGGRSGATVGGVCPTTPYTAVPLYGFGNGGSRDGGAGPIFTGFAMKMVTATGPVAIGAAIEAGWLNRSDFVMQNTESAFGSAVAASVGPSIFELE